MNEMFLLKLGEIVLKGGNRFQFENRLKTNIARRMRPFGDFRVVCCYGTAIAHRAQILGRVKAPADSIAVATYSPAAILGTLGLRSIFDQLQTICSDHCQNRIEIGRLAIQVNGDDSPRPRGYGSTLCYFPHQILP